MRLSDLKLTAAWPAGTYPGKLPVLGALACLWLAAVTTGCQTTSSSPLLSSDELRRLEVSKDVRERFLPADRSQEVMTIYGTLFPLAPGIEIWPSRNKDDVSQPPPVYTLSKRSWFFVVDHNSVAQFAHDVTFVIVPDDGSAYEVYEEKWWPVIEHQNHWFHNGFMDAPREFMVYEGVIAADWRAAGRVFP